MCDIAGSQLCFEVEKSCHIPESLQLGSWDRFRGAASRNRAAKRVPGINVPMPPPGGLPVVVPVMRQQTWSCDDTPT
jgi:hypothetical protein